ncbi:hypothetical protein N7G274_010202 [Stereocaulon virgatum]|uniref:5-Methylcytosine G/T mismatch-specific DNA glycosylase n=1 Tax=Stereocaulon virgatum TaxID=373712 RepID=A0ABR3ZVA4_9LECA
MPSAKPRDKEKEKDPETPSRSKDKSRHRSSRARRADKAITPPERRSTNPSPTTTKRRASLPVPELEDGGSSASPLGSKTNLPYPSFSKAHSKEAIGSRDNVANPRLSYYTPDPTDLDKEKDRDRENGIQPTTGVAPPSPPETALDQDMQAERPTTEQPTVEKPKVKKARMESAHVSDAEEETPKIEKISVRKTRAQAPRDSSPEVQRPKARRSDVEKRRPEKPKPATIKLQRKPSDLQKAAEYLGRKLRRVSSEASEKPKNPPPPAPRSRNSLREASHDDEKPILSARRSKPGTPSKPSTPLILRPKQATVEDSTSSVASDSKAVTSDLSSLPKSETTNASTTDSGATERPITPRVDRNSSPATDPDSSPRTPTLAEPQFPPSGKATPFSALGEHERSTVFIDSPLPPPPPPPPPEVPMPKVDYLMQHGGLPQPIPKSLLSAGQSNQPTQVASAMAAQYFSPINKLLDDYDRVISRNGSLAVATGYRSVARRLLDRLEAVFARDISCETCNCILCQVSEDYEASPDDKRGVSWGEIFEYVSGRQELPQWPAFVMDATQTGLCISASEHIPPMQKLDVDVPDEFRDHYIRQSKKTKMSVDRWLDSQTQCPSSPPQDVDDETLTFAMLTRLEPEQRPVFSSLIGVIPSRPNSTTGEALINPQSSLLENTGLAIQRLYRLPELPRDPESAMYLLSNPHLHNVLATLAAISDGEWEILISGRFDGFLRSGADDNFFTNIPPPARGSSRGPTPSLPPSRGPTPFSRNPTPATGAVGAPVTIDEENEIAALAEVEREIFLSMEALEDAFEALHNKAHTVRCAMIDRHAGLARANQRRRGSLLPEARLSTPASQWDGSETEDGLDDAASELMPDDSASNISVSRHRRVKRRHERRTPALVEEDGESGVGAGGGKWK